MLNEKMEKFDEFLNKSWRNANEKTDIKENLAKELLNIIRDNLDRGQTELVLDVAKNLARQNA